MWVCHIQSVEGLNEKMANPPESKGELLLPDYLKLGHWSFPAFGLKRKHRLFLRLEPAGFGLELTPSSPLGLQLANCRS